MEFSFRGAGGATRPGDVFHAEGGQALVEYILILVVTVALILGLMFEFNTAFQAWANNYFGDYLTCLLETGELPSIGGSPGDSGVCNQFFQPFSLKNGRPSSVLSQNGNGSNNKSSSANRSTGRARSESSSSGRSGNFRNGQWAGSGHSPPALNSDDRKDAGGTTKTGNTGLSSGGGYSGSMNPRRPGESGGQISGRLGGGFKKDPAEKKGYAPGTARADEGHSPKRLRLKATRRPAAIVDEGTPLTFGNFIRILIIAAIIIALVIVVGGQLLQITKGMDD